MTERFNVSTQKHYQLIDITSNVETAVNLSSTISGTVIVYTPHSTAAILVTENESGLINDWLDFVKKQFIDMKFEHDPLENNTDAHIFSGLIGQEKTFIIENGKIYTGKWQQIFLAEFDGPKIREVIIKIIND